MRSENVNMELIQLLIDRVQHQQGGARENKASYDKLLTLSEQFDYAYGQALAHVYLAKYFLELRESKYYYFHLERARSIAESKSYFDVQMTYCRLEGIRHATESNETTALALYLRGHQIALEIKDNMAKAGFCRDIGNLFYSTAAYDDAERFYREALEQIENFTLPDAQFQRKAALVGLVHLACIKRELQQAQKYMNLSKEINATSRNLDFLQQEGAAYILLLEDNQSQAREAVAGLMKLIHGGEYRSLPESAYFILIQMLLELKDQTGAAHCIEKLDELCKYAGQNTVLRTQKVRIQYAEVFNLANVEQYRMFYEITMDSELSRGQAIGESFKNLIALYETKKQRDNAQIEQSELEAIVNIDELTQIYNRRYLGKLITKLSQDERVSSLGFVMIDVDFFKEYNDCYGHPQGDVALTAVAALLAKNLPEDAYAVRYGGDEFVCLFVDKSEAEIEAFVQGVQQALKLSGIAHSGSGGQSKMMTLSFGIYNETNPAGISGFTLAQRADEALYQAKEQGRDTYAIYKKLREDM